MLHCSPSASEERHLDDEVSPSMGQVSEASANRVDLRILAAAVDHGLAHA